MKQLPIIVSAIAMLLFGVPVWGQQSGMKKASYVDTFADEGYLSQFARYQRYLPFIKYSENYVEWGKLSAIDNFYYKLSRANHKKVNVLHIGDSHIQADFFTGYLRENIQQIFGHGGRGFVFPYACAGTHSTYDYRTWKYGRWEGARNVKNPKAMDLGLTGAVALTNDDEAGFRFGFKEGIMKEDFTVMKIYCKKSDQSFNLKLKLSNYDDTIFITANVRPELPYVLVNMPIAADTFEIFVNKTDSQQNFFECYGLLIESKQDKGILYNSVGINGAGYWSILNSSVFESQLKDLKPDLVVIDLGANDFYGYTFNEIEMAANLERILDMIKRANPNASIVVSCSQDIYRKRKNVFATSSFEEVTEQTALANDVAWYNYFSVSGGRYSMLKWRRYQLAKKDKVHLTTAGYHVKGDLLLNAYLNSYIQFLKKKPSSLIVPKGGFDITGDEKFIYKETYIDPETDTTKTKLVHKVKKGEKLKTIAKKYKVDEEDIMDWNGLENAYITRGQKLDIFIDKTPTTTTNIIDTEEVEAEKPAPKKPAPKKPAPTKKTTTVKYKVKNGDTLWSIAQRHGTTVARIKQLNNLRSDFLRLGQILIISK